MNEAELKLANCILPRLAEKTRRKAESEAAYQYALSVIRSRCPTVKAVQVIRMTIGVTLQPYHIVLWRKLIEMNNEKLLPELAVLKATSPLVLVHSSPPPSGPSESMDSTS
jgi:hypothetical protein